MQTMRRAWAALAVAALAAGCANVPQEAPAKPHFQREGESPFVWRLPEIALAGSAEYGSTLTLARDPAFEAGEAPAGPVVADEYTAQFVFPGVKLKPGQNSFTVTAKNAFGTSEAAKLVVQYVDQPSGIEVSLSSNIVVAGQEQGAGALTVTAKLVAGVDRLKLDGRDVTFRLGGAGGGAPKTAQTDEAGSATVTFTGLTQVGPATVTALLGAGDSVDASVSDTKPFVVSAGPAATLSLLLAKAGQTGASGTSLGVKAGEDAVASVQVKDSVNNAIDAPVTLFTDAPGAVVTGLRITNLKVTGSFHVVAAVSGVATRQGAAVSDVATLTVDAGDPKSLKLVAPAQAVAGEALGYQATLFDQFGNAVDGGAARPVAIDATSDTQAQVKSADKQVIFKTAGAQKLIATVANTTPALSDQVNVLVVPATPATLQLALAGVDKIPATADLLDIEANASATIQTTVTVKDAFGNLVPGAGVLLSTDGTGYFDGGVLKGLVKAGRYEVRAVGAQGALVDRKPFQIVAAAGTTATLDLGASQVDAGTPVPFNARAWDAYGNLASDALLLAVDGLQPGDYAIDAGAKTLAVKKAGTGAWTVRATGATNTQLQAATASLLVRPGAAAALTIDVTPSNSVVAGTNPGFTAAAKDAYGNALVNPPFTFSVLPAAGTLVDPPGPIVSAGKIYNLIRPGTYQLIAQLPGTGLTNDLSDPKATLQVSAAAAATVSLVLSRTVAEVGSPVDFQLLVKDQFGNAAQGTAQVAVKQGSTTVAPLVDGLSWTASAAGSYQLVATVTAGSKTLTDTQTLTVTPAPDYTAPTLSFDRPANDPTIAAWPPADKVAGACAGNNGDLVGVTATDPSLVQTAWFDFGGLASALAQGTAPSVGFPQSPFVASVPLCNNQVTGARGEVLVKFAASDTQGNYRSAQGSWCVDADAQAYLPANVTASRCRVLKDEPTAAKTQALAANQAGDLVLAREQANGDAALVLFGRTDSYGLGLAHVFTGFGSPRGVALFGRTAFVSAVSTAKTFLQRTRSLDKQGNGADDSFVAVDTTSDQFYGVLYSQDGALWATVLPRDGSYSTKLYRFASPLDFSKSYTQLPAATASSTTLRLTALCDGARSGDLFATGYAKPANAGDPGKAVLARINTATGAVTTVFTDTDVRTVSGCQLTKAGVALALSKDGATAVTLVDPASGQLAAQPMMSAYASGAAVVKPLGLAQANGYLFAATSEASVGSLLRFARPGGF